MDKDKVQHDHKCDNCGKPATRNLQESWVKYLIDKEGNFSEPDVQDNIGENCFFCDDCDY